jgi:hypothetical protein
MMRFEFGRQPQLFRGWRALLPFSWHCASACFSTTTVSIATGWRLEAWILWLPGGELESIGAHWQATLIKSSRTGLERIQDAIQPKPMTQVTTPDDFARTQVKQDPVA